MAGEWWFYTEGYAANAFKASIRNFVRKVAKSGLKKIVLATLLIQSY